MAERHTAIIGKQLRAAVAADGLRKDASENLAVDVSDFAGTGLEDDGSENLRIAAAAAGDGLTGGGGSALAVGAGDGIDVAVDAVAVDVTDIIDTAYGLTENANDIRISIKDNDGLMFGGSGPDAGKLLIEYDNVTIGIVANELAVKASGIDTDQLASEAVTEDKIDISNAPTNGYYLKYVTDHMEWADVSAGYVEKADVIANEIPSGDINGANVTFVLANSPASGTVQVYLNGIMQEPGSGKDYTIADDTITFAQAPDTLDILLCNYVIA